MSIISEMITQHPRFIFVILRTQKPIENKNKNVYKMWRILVIYVPEMWTVVRRSGKLGPSIQRNKSTDE